MSYMLFINNKDTTIIYTPIRGIIFYDHVKRPNVN